jgi:alkanesulfonate monooxygenase SsuD/methylene tetrahydromethanopterin reductase-like flavin-dependent oxidoreductase (luciferase family)
MAATVDQMSGGWLRLGLGSAWYQPEHKSFGIDFRPAG